MLSFDAETHAYFWDGARVPNVTSLLGFLTDYKWVQPDALERARQEGVAIHRMVELSIKGELDLATLPDWLIPRLAAWHKFIDDTGFEPITSEQKLYHRELRYAGTCDTVGTMPKLRRVKKNAMVDIKRSLYAGRAIGYQTSAYAKAWDFGAPRDMGISNRFALVLKAEGTYQLNEYTDPGDFGVFLSCLTLYRAKEKLCA